MRRVLTNRKDSVGSDNSSESSNSDSFFKVGKRPKSRTPNNFTVNFLKFKLTGCAMED